MRQKPFIKTSSISVRVLSKGDVTGDVIKCGIYLFFTLCNQFLFSHLFLSLCISECVGKGNGAVGRGGVA